MYDESRPVARFSIGSVLPPSCRGAKTSACGHGTCTHYRCSPRILPERRRLWTCSYRSVRRRSISAPKKEILSAPADSTALGACKSGVTIPGVSPGIKQPIKRRFEWRLGATIVSVDDDRQNRVGLPGVGASASFTWPIDKMTSIEPAFTLIRRNRGDGRAASVLDHGFK